MYTLGVLGAGLLILGPYIETFMVCLATRRPQLILLALLSATCALLPSVVTSLIYLLWPSEWRWSWRTALSPSSPTPVSSAALLGIQNTLLYAMRGVVCWAAWCVQTRMRRDLRQVIVYSRYRLALVSLSVGFGFGFTSAVLLGAGPWLDATLHMDSITPGVTIYNLDVCPQLPTLLHASLQSFLLTCCHASWGVMVGQSVAAVQAVGLRTFTQLLRPSDRVESLEVGGAIVSDSTLQAETKSGVAAADVEATTTAPESSQGVAPRAARRHTHFDTNRICVPPSSAPCTIIPADTRLVDHPRVVCLTLLAAAVLQFVFSFLSLFHGAALDVLAGTESASHGCVVSLPLQLVTTAISVLYAFWLLRVEHVKMD